MIEHRQKELLVQSTK